MSCTERQEVSGYAARLTLAEIRKYHLLKGL